MLSDVKAYPGQAPGGVPYARLRPVLDRPGRLSYAMFSVLFMEPLSFSIFFWSIMMA